MGSIEEHAQTKNMLSHRRQSFILTDVAGLQSEKMQKIGTKGSR
jgi:hypothetical protein